MQETKCKQTNKQTNKRGGAAHGGIFFASANAGLIWLAIPLATTRGTRSLASGTSPSGGGLLNGEAEGMIETEIPIYCHSAAEPGCRMLWPITSSRGARHGQQLVADPSHMTKGAMARLRVKRASETRKTSDPLIIREFRVEAEGRKHIPSPQANFYFMLKALRSLGHSLTALGH